MPVDFQEFFENYVANMMLADVSREIAAATRGENAGNLLSALGLLSYTEVMGRFVPGVERGSRNAFTAFFRRLGPTCATFLDTPGEDPYDTYRNGIVHTYLAKRPAVIAMLDGDPPAPCGVFRSSEDGRYVFVVQRYFGGRGSSHSLQRAG